MEASSSGWFMKTTSLLSFPRAGVGLWKVLAKDIGLLPTLSSWSNRDLYDAKAGRFANDAETVLGGAGGVK
jgi:hypothetical protein